MAPPQYTGEQMKRMLVAGGQHIDRYTVQAALHLLTFTELPARPGFAELVDVELVDDGSGAPPIRAAFVRDWTALRTAGHLGGAGLRLLALAASLATGAPVDLADTVSGLGHAHARRVIEAFAIATGAAELYTVAPTLALDDMLARRDALSSAG